MSRSSDDDFCPCGAKVRRLGFFGFLSAGGPTAAGSPAFLGRGLLRIRSWCLGGRAVGGRRSSSLYRANSSLALVVLFRRRLKSVADVLKGIRNKDFYYWEAVCRDGSCGPISSLDPWDR